MLMLKCVEMCTFGVMIFAELEIWNICSTHEPHAFTHLTQSANKQTVRNFNFKKRRRRKEYTKQTCTDVLHLNIILMIV